MSRRPPWLAPLERAEAVAGWQTTDPLRDATDVVLSLRVGAADLTVVGLIDINTAGALTDGFVIPAPLASFQEAFAATGASGMESWDLTPADAAARLTEAITAGRAVEPPLTSDSWPQARPLAEWAARLCPPGGQGLRRRVWSVAEIERIVAEFAGTGDGSVVADAEDRAVLVSALHVLGTRTYGDPLLPSATRLEMGLGHMWATALHHEPDRLLALPEALGPYVRWAHARRGIPADDTEVALAAIAPHRAVYTRDVAALFEAPD